MKDWQIVAVPFSSEPGHDMWRGPERILASMALEPWQWAPIPLDEASVEGWRRLAEAFRDEVSPDLQSDRPWLFITGECTVAPMPVGALQRVYGAVQVVWIDAHGDIHTPDSSTSHFLGGMPLNLLMGKSLESVRQAAGAQAVPIEHVTMVGTRDLDPAEERFIRDWNIEPIDDTREIRRRVEAIGLPAYVHVDIDVLDPKVNPAASYPSPRGMTLEALLTILRDLSSTGLMRAVTVAAYSPGLDVDAKGLSAASAIVRQLLEDEA